MAVLSCRGVTGAQKQSWNNPGGLQEVIPSLETGLEVRLVLE